jgi:hypothetical protein
MKNKILGHNLPNRLKNKGVLNKKHKIFQLSYSKLIKKNLTCNIMIYTKILDLNKIICKFRKLKNKEITYKHPKILILKLNNMNNLCTLDQCSLCGWIMHLKTLI